MRTVMRYALVLLFLSGWLAGAGLTPAAAMPLAEKTFNIVGKGDMIVIPVPPEEAVKLSAALDSYRNSGSWPRSVNAVLLAVPGQQPAIVLSGRAEDVQQARLALQPLLDLLETKQLVAVTVDLRQVTLNTGEELGFNALDPDTGISGSYSRSRSGTEIYNNNTGAMVKKQYTADTWGLAANGTIDSSGTLRSSYQMLKFQDTWNKGRTIVSGEVYTENGGTSEMRNKLNYPLITMNSYSGSSVYYQNIDSTLIVRPTIVHYDKQELQNSTVKLDIGAQISFITNIFTQSGGTNPEFTTKTVDMSRIVPADNSPVLIGSFVSDIFYDTVVGWPVLKDIPLIKHFFSQQTKQKQRIAAVLTASVRIIPREAPPAKAADTAEGGAAVHAKDAHDR